MRIPPSKTTHPGKPISPGRVNPVLKRFEDKVATFVQSALAKGPVPSTLSRPNTTKNCLHFTIDSPVPTGRPIEVYKIEQTVYAMVTEGKGSGVQAVCYDLGPLPPKNSGSAKHRS